MVHHWENWCRISFVKLSISELVICRIATLSHFPFVVASSYFDNDDASTKENSHQSVKSTWTFKNGKFPVTHILGLSCKRRQHIPIISHFSISQVIKKTLIMLGLRAASKVTFGEKRKKKKTFVQSCEHIVLVPRLVQIRVSIAPRAVERSSKVNSPCELT
jgi:hypothetical protein